MTSIFLSYARGDDSEPYDASTSFVTRLHRDLTGAGFDAWFDRVSLPSRQLTFHQEIADAIRARDRLVLVVGPKAALSDYVRQEWRWALELDKPVIPILRQGDISHLPGELSLLHCDDFREDAQYPAQLAKLIENLRLPAPPLGALYGVPNLPPYFLGRPELLHRVKDALLVDLQEPVVISGAVSRVGMQGMGGIGKSVLAAALARDFEVRRSYPDGIIWVTVGQQPDRVRLQRDVARHLGNQEPFQTEVQGQGVLRQLLAQKAVLLVLDDVWQATDAQAFDVLGPRCRALVTTRDAGILRTMGGQSVPVSLFTETEALQLLADAVGVERAALPREAHEVVKECGCLPLAVALCGGMAKAGHSWQDIVGALHEADLEWPEDREATNEQHRTIWNAMKASYDALPDNEKPRFAELAVFASDRTVPEAAVHTLWKHTGQLTYRNCAKLLVNLAERSLIQLDQKAAQPGEAVERRFRLHDLVYDFASRIAGERKAMHKTLLEAYRSECPGGWQCGPDDGYFFRYLPMHLAEAHWWDELLAVIAHPDMAYLTRWLEGGDGEIGILCLSQLVNHFESTGDKTARALGLATQLARLHVARGAFEEGEHTLKHLLEQASPETDRRVRAIALHELGSLRLYAGDSSAATHLFREALKLCNLAKPIEHDEASANLVALATIAMAEYNHDRAARLARRALRRAEIANDTRHAVASQRILANVYKDNEQWEEAENHLFAASLIAGAEDLALERLVLLIVHGWLSYARAVLDGTSIDDAVCRFQKALEDAVDVHQFLCAVEARLGLTWCALFCKATDDAARWIAELDVFGLENSHRNLAAMQFLGKAAVFHQKNESAKAQKQYQKAIDFSCAFSELASEADAWVGLGSIHWHLGSAAEANACWQKAVERAAKCSRVRRRIVELSIDQGMRDPTTTPK